MSARNTTRSSRLLIDEEPLQVIPTLACKVGLNRAMFLQQLHYWLQKPGSHERDGKRWIHNTFEEWHEQFPFWTAEGIRKIVSQLEEKDVIETTDRHNSRKGDRTKWYTLNYEVFNALFDFEETAPDKSTEPHEAPDKSTEQPDKSTHHEPDKSTERYQRETSNRDSPEGATKVAAEVEEEEEKPVNYMTVFADMAKNLGYQQTPEDKRELPKNFKLTANGLDDATMRQVVWRVLDARNRNYQLSPQKALQEIRGNVSSIGRTKAATGSDRITFDQDETMRCDGQKVRFTDDGYERDIWIGQYKQAGWTQEKDLILAALRERGMEPEYQRTGT